MIEQTLPYPVLYPLLWLWTHFFIGYIGMAFTFLHAYKFIPMHANFNYLFTWLIPLLILVVLMLPKQPRKTQPKDAAVD